MGVVDEKDVVVVSALLGEELEKVGGGCGVAAVEWKRLVCGDRVGWGVGLEEVGGGLWGGRSGREAVSVWG